MAIVSVDFRFGDVWKVTNFVQKENPQIREIADKIDQEVGDNIDTRVEAIARYVGLKFRYPLNLHGATASEAELKRFKRTPRSWIWKAFRDYTWLFPAETDTCRWGICIDTANLFTSIARALDIPAKVSLGPVYRTQDDQLLGYHAWSRLTYKGLDHIAETTIHGTDRILIPTQDLYGKKLDVYYVEEAWFDENEYHDNQIGEGGLAALEKHRQYYVGLRKRAKKKRKDHPEYEEDKIHAIREAVKKYYRKQKK